MTDPHKKEYRCPSCQRLLFDRRQKTCGDCGTALPEELLFNKEELEEIDRELAQIDEDHRQFLKKQMEDEIRKRKE